MHDFLDRSRLLFALFAAFAFAQVFAPITHAADGHSTEQVESEVPRGYESYDSRSDIFAVSARAHPELGEDWENIKRAQVEGVAMLLEMYPDREIYFLARDSEYLYDLARYVTRSDLRTQQRLHLLNISRANMAADHVKEYLAQEGISADLLRAGKKILFFDTGYAGTIPRVIAEYFPEALRNQMSTQLLCSSNREHPSSRAFLSALNPAAPGLNPSSLHATIASYEHLPHGTARSDQFARIHGRWTPLSTVDGANEGIPSKGGANALREDLLAYISKSETQEFLKLRRAHWAKIRKLHETAGSDAEPLKNALKALLNAHPNDPFTESSIRDFIELKQTLLPGGPPISEADLDLAPVRRSKSHLSKDELIKKYPKWARALREPETELYKMVTRGEFGMLGAISDTYLDWEFTRILTKALGDAPLNLGSMQFIEAMIKGGEISLWGYLAQYTFAKHRGPEAQGLLKLLIDQGGEHVLKYLPPQQPCVASGLEAVKLQGEI